MQQYELQAHPQMQPIDHALIARQPSMGAAIRLCQSLSGLDDKHFTGPGGVVKDLAQWSRITSPTAAHNFPHEKFNVFMDLAGNEAPLLWLLQSRGYDLNSLRLRETETEKALRIAKEQLAASELKNRVLVEALHGRVTA